MMDIKLFYKYKFVIISTFFTVMFCLSINLSKYLNVYFKQGIVLSFFGLIFILYTFIFIKCRNKATSFLGQLLIINLCTFLYYLIMFFYNRINIYGSIGLAGICLSFWGIFVFSFLIIKSKNKIIFQIDFFKTLPYIILISLFLIFNVDVFNTWIKNDSYIYFESIENSILWNLSFDNSFEYLKLGNHMSYGYTPFVQIGYLLDPITGNGIRIIHLAFGTITILLIPKIIERFFPNNSSLKIICAIFFAFSPLLSIGISEINLDYPTLCFFVWLFYCHIKNYNILLLFTSAMFVLTKEPSVFFLFIYVLFWSISKIVYYLKISTYNTKNFLTQITVFAISGLIWISCTISSGKLWGSTIERTLPPDNMIPINSIGLNTTIILSKLKQLFVMNYSWVLYFLLIISMIIYLYKKKRIVLIFQLEKCEYLIGLTGFFLAFLLFNLFYITYVPYRYTQPKLFIEIFLLALIIYLNKKMILQTILPIAFCIVTITSNYYTSDILTLSLFRNINIGKTTIISTRVFGPDSSWKFLCTEEQYVNQYLFSNSIVYNKQYLSLEECFEKFLKTVNYTQNDVIIFPDAFEGLSIYNILGRRDYDSYFWDNNTNNLTLNSGKQKLNLFTKETCDIEDLKVKFKNIYYVSFPFMETETDNNIFSSYPKASITQDGWILKYYVIQSKK